VQAAQTPPSCTAAAQVWFKAAAGLDYNGKGACPYDPTAPAAAAPADKWIPDWGLCPYGGHDGPVTWTTGGLYIKCSNETQPAWRCSGPAGARRFCPPRTPPAARQPSSQSPTVNRVCVNSSTVRVASACVGLYQCVPSSNSTGGNSTFANQQQCLQQCKAPPPPPPGPPPPAPHYDKPYVSIPNFE
jgi:hypothetical protein